MKPLLVIKTGTKIPSLDCVAGDYDSWIAQGMGVEAASVISVDVGADEKLPGIDAIAAVAITGSGAMVTDGDDWIERSAEWLRGAAESGVPILGICFGHQLLAHALGGMVDNNPRGIEVGTVTVTLSEAGVGDPLFGDMPPRFPAQVSHTQSVLSLPPGARLLASSEMEPHQAFAWGERAWGLQFHPEFDEQIIPHFIHYYEESLSDVGRTTAPLLSQVMPTSESASLLRRFAELAGLPLQP